MKVHELFAYLRVKDAGKAIDFYKQALGAEEKFRRAPHRGCVVRRDAAAVHEDDEGRVGVGCGRPALFRGGRLRSQLRAAIDAALKDRERQG